MINRNSLRRWQPVRPLVPLRLWGTAVAVTVTCLNAGFYAEVWSSSVVSGWAWLALLGLLLLASLQAVPVLWGWPPPPLAPRWGQWLWRAGMRAAVLGLCLWLLLGAVGAGFLVSSVCADGFAGNR